MEPTNDPINEPTTEPTSEPTIHAAINSTIVPTLALNPVPTARRRSLLQWGDSGVNTPTLTSSPTKAPPTIDPTHVVAHTFDFAIYDTTPMTINVHTLNTQTELQSTNFTMQWNFINGLCSDPQLTISIVGQGGAFNDGYITFYSDAARTNMIGECDVRQWNDCNVWQTCFSSALSYITDGVQS
eukprot:172016_1